MSLLSQFFGGKTSIDQTLGSYNAGLSTGFSEQIPVDIMLIGGGGGGGAAATVPFAGVAASILTAFPSSFTGGTGGAGRGLSYTNCIVNTNTVYPITVGAGGAQNSIGGYSSIGVIRAGGGGAGGGQSPAGVPITNDFSGLYGGSDGGFGAGAPGITIFGGIGGSVPRGERIHGADDSSLQYTFPPGTTVPVFRAVATSNSSNIFTQAINSTVYPLSPIPSGSLGPNSPAGLPGPATYVEPYGPFANRPVAVGYLGGANPLIGSPGIYDFHTGAPERWGLPTNLIVGAGRSNYMVGTTIQFQAFPGGPDLGFDSVAIPNGAPNPFFAKYLNPFTPDFNIMVRSVTDDAYLIIDGGNYTVPTVVLTANQAAPSVTMVAQTTKSASWTINPNVGGSPGNGGGGGGGLRHAPVLMQGTITSPVYSPSPTVPPANRNITRVAPYALNIEGTAVPAASGGAGGSGSVWIIYPSDYAAATVTGDTPVPSPPAVRIYRWDGAGTITFNAS